jgi:hypothetical protein
MVSLSATSCHLLQLLVCGSLIFGCSSTTSTTSGTGGDAGAASSSGGAGSAGASGGAGSAGTPTTVDGLNAPAWDLGGGRVRLFWDFSDPAQLQDWVGHNASLSIINERLSVSELNLGSGLQLAAFSRGVKVALLSFTGRLVAGDHMNAYVSTYFDGNWAPANGYGLIHNGSGRLWVIDGVEDNTGVGGTVNTQQVYKVRIDVTDTSLTWTVNDSPLTIERAIVRSTDRQVGLGNYSSNTTFDDVTIEGTLEPL